jgi:hypothetical protein
MPRPSHPAPNVRDDREAPLMWVRDARRIVLICPTAQGKMCTTGSLRMAGMRASLSTSLRGATRRSNPDCRGGDSLDCFAALAMTVPLAIIVCEWTLGISTAGKSTSSVRPTCSAPIASATRPSRCSRRPMSAPCRRRLRLRASLPMPRARWPNRCRAAWCRQSGRPAGRTRSARPDTSPS